MTLGWILAASVAGGTLSAGLAAASLALRATWVPMLVSFAIGALLGVVAASMIHVAVADLIPGLHRKPELRDTASHRARNRGDCRGGRVRPALGKKYYTVRRLQTD
jgi:zinc transporter ZupT